MSGQPCQPKRVEEVLRELVAYRAKHAGTAAGRLARLQALATEIQAELDRERAELLALVASYQEREGQAQAALARCLGILESLAKNRALALDRFQVDTCTLARAEPCPPETRRGLPAHDGPTVARRGRPPTQK